MERQNKPPQVDTALKGIKTLDKWHKGEESLPLSSPIIFEKTTVRAKPRGKTEEVTLSLNDFLSPGSAYSWWKKDPDGVKKALQKDPTLQNVLGALSEIIEGIQVDGTENNLHSYALLERIAEVDLLAKPHLPRSLQNENTDNFQQKDVKLNQKNEEAKGGQKSNQHELERETYADNQETTQGFLKRFTAFMNSLDRKATSNLSRFIASSPSMMQDAPLSTGSHENKSSLSSRKAASPFTHLPSSSGKERFLGDDHLPKNTLVEYINPGRVTNANFCILSIANEYDPLEGTLTTHTTKQPAITQQRDSWWHRYEKESVFIHISKEDVQNAETIALPHPVSSGGQRETILSADLLKSLAVQSVEVFTKDKQNQLLSSEETEPYVFVDSLGNLSLDLSTMPEKAKIVVDRQDIAVHTSFSPQYDYENRWQTNLETSQPELLGGHTKNEKETFLYPVEIQKLLQTLQKKYREQKDDYQPKSEKERQRLEHQKELYYSKEKIFYKIAQFLGNYWLTYKETDAPHQESDPLSYTQTERVLSSRIASCEGANIALGELMRYFLDEGEGIAYVTGFSLEDYSRNERIATENHLHLKVMYKDAKNNVSFFDATPWRKDSKDQVQQEIKNHKVRKRSWHEDISNKDGATELLNAKKEIIENAESAWQSLEEVWNHKRYKKEYTHTLFEMDTPIGEFDGYSHESKDFLGVPSHDYLMGDYIHGRETQALLLRYQNTRKCPIDATMSIYSNPFQNRLFGNDYHSMSSSPDDYLPKDLNFKKALFQNPYYMDIVLCSYKATIQNTEVIDLFTDQMLELTKKYEGRFQQVLSSVAEKLPSCDPKTFFAQAPFLLLLPHPLNELERIFSRGYDWKERGFLSPSYPEGIAFMLEDKLEAWEEAVKKRLLTIADLLLDAPLETSPVLPPFPFPEMRFWPQDETQQPVTSLGKEERYLDPLTTFAYLADALWKLEEEGQEE